ncbi:MAG: hypothetical protein N2689_13650 [Verrucomicrobiae bacterium]|nr:hypothetical protein [Verrucomicrobiae bacterium]
MTTRDATSLDRALARVCAVCPVCHHARKTQRGVMFEFVKKVEDRLCPFCAAYARVHGRKPHEPTPR